MGRKIERKKSTNKSETQSFGTPTREGHDSSRFYGRKMYEKKKATQSEVNYDWNCPDKVDVIYCHDSRNMKHLPDKSVHLMVTSPPYNVGKDYDSDLSFDEYKSLLFDVLNEVYRVLVVGGRACINIANIGRTPYIPLHSHVIEIALNCGFLMRGEIIWDKGASAGVSCAWGSWRSASNPVLRDVHEYILVFCKGIYNRTSSQKQEIDRDQFLEYTKSIWKFNTTSAKKAGHPAPFPLELPSRLIELYSFHGDIVLDPFIGSGTTALSAQGKGRKYIGYDINRDYVQLALSKLGQNEVKFQNLNHTESNPIL